MFTINGIGTILYGKKYISYKELYEKGIITEIPKRRNFKPYIATKWFVFLYVPIIPLGSYVILDEYGYDSGLYADKKYLMVRYKLDLEQVRNGYLILIAVILFIVLLLRYFSI
jgi:hypothetical protein